ncbi:hypothetical protein T492DRAFT_1087835, partial [Pavlovales sp. CCMP2436]
MVASQAVPPSGGAHREHQGYDGGRRAINYVILKGRSMRVANHRSDWGANRGCRAARRTGHASDKRW